MRHIRRNRACAILALVASFLCASPARADEIITLETRPGVTQSMQLWTPHEIKPKAIALLIPGGPGNIGLRHKEGRVEVERPHLFSTWRDALLQGQFAVAVLDASSDQGDMTQEFRTSTAHMHDMQAVIGELQRRFPHARLIMVAHSRGTITAGYIARLLDGQISAAVLLSGLYQATLPGPNAPSSGPGLSQIDLLSLKTPFLLVHHINDSCPVAPVSAAEKLGARIPLISIGGSTELEDAFPCGPGSNHWFSGHENDVTQQVVHWLTEKSDYPN